MSAYTESEMKRVAALRLQMLELHPFWGHLLVQMEVVASPELASFAATDCQRTIWFNPNRTRHLSSAQLGFVLAHELGHVFLVSGERRRGRDLYLWNAATDYVINRLVSRIQHPARPGRPLYVSPNGIYPELGEIQILLDQRFEDRIAEAIYERLAAEQDRGTVEVTVKLALPGNGGGQLNIPNVSDHQGGIDIHLPTGFDGEMSDSVAETLQAAVTAWVQSGRRGDVPGSVHRLLVPNQQPTIAWHQVLRRYLGHAMSRAELSYQRPNLRYLVPTPRSGNAAYFGRRPDEGFILPGASQGGLGYVIVALDTSASMDRTILDQVAAELRAVAHQVEDITLIVADAKVHHVEHGGAIDKLLSQGRVRGGGGTDHRPVFHWIRQQGRQPDLFIGLTDLYSCFPDTPPAYPIIWVAPKAHGQAPWGQILNTGT
jgi:predicted metal-dependent peptidase